MKYIIKFISRLTIITVKSQKPLSIEVGQNILELICNHSRLQIAKQILNKTRIELDMSNSNSIVVLKTNNKV